MSALAEFSGGTAVVTGAASGIGSMLARGLASAGMRVGALDLRRQAAVEVAEQIGGGAFPIHADVSDRESVAAAAEDLRRRGESLSLLWINAGVGIGAGVLDASPRSVEWLYGVNVLGMVWTAQAFVPLLRPTAGVRHLGITASSASLASPQAPLTLYAASKHACLGLAEGLAAELEPEDIGTTILCPGLLDTEIWNSGRARPERFGGPRETDPAISGRWRAAPDPERLWPHIERVVASGGGTLVVSTDPELGSRVRARQDRLQQHWVDL